MRKSVRFGLAVMCATLTLFSVTDTANAAPKTVKNAERSVANWYWSDEGEVWPPVAGRYERKNDNGVTNAYINVTVLPDQWPVVTLRACDYNGTDDEKGWEALSRAQAVVLGGQIIGLAITDSPPNKKYIKAGMKPVQLRLGAQFATGAEVLGIHRGNGTGAMLDDVQIQLMHAGVKSEKDGLVLDYFGHNGLALPDVRGKYVLNKNRTPRADEFAACALVAALPVRETNTDFTDKTLQIIPEAVTGSMMPRYKYIIKNYGFAVKVFQNGTLLRTFMVPKDLSAVYRFDSDGGDVMIYNIDGSKG
ncbi:MAG: hypothetical protein IJG43_05940 [Acidaminococcaceae bacterium]|nr:hypothetical protein [Acidaminococcaceae bacterium]